LIVDVDRNGDERSSPFRSRSARMSETPRFVVIVNKRRPEAASLLAGALPAVDARPVREWSTAVHHGRLRDRSRHSAHLSRRREAEEAS
jgi:hypothetical protein